MFSFFNFVAAFVAICVAVVAFVLGQDTAGAVAVVVAMGFVGSAAWASRNN